MRLVRVSILAAIAAIGVAAVPGTAAADSTYLIVKGVKQGLIKGSVLTKGHEGAIGVVAWSHEIVSPRDAASGLPTGKRQHKQLIVSASIDRSVPLLLSALANNESLSEVRLDVYKPDRLGVEQLYYSIRLTNASAARVFQGTQPNPSRPPSETQPNTLFTVQFTYQKIEWTFANGGVTSMDDWETPVM